MMISRSIGRSSRDHVVVVVGGGDGIGAATAKHIGCLGASVFVIDSDPAAAATTAAAVGSTGARVGSTGADVSDVDSVQRALHQAARWTGRLHAVVNTSALHERAPSNLEDFERLSRSVLTSALVIAHAVVPRMYKDGYGRIVHVAPVGDLALVGLVRSQANELATAGIAVNALIPAKAAILEAAALVAYLTSPGCTYPTGATLDFS